ncbi:Homoaconitase [Echinococcus multilocularis]|uniref:Homoaconitase n=1 Tax=Echinococcus multilocularis TaxID=6211 RepID=A0A0S4MIW1_ECHMU|nr:Homoaconitase [Echinococcus multilocularis]
MWWIRRSSAIPSSSHTAFDSIRVIRRSIRLALLYAVDNNKTVNSFQLHSDRRDSRLKITNWYVNEHLVLYCMLILPQQ